MTSGLLQTWLLRSWKKSDEQSKIWSDAFSIGPFAVFLLIPTLLPLLSDEKVEQAATFKRRKIQSMILQQKMLADSKYLPMYGSSEFARMDAFHPSNYSK